MGRPHMTCVAVGSNDPSLSILAVADLMEKKGGPDNLGIDSKNMEMVCVEVCKLNPSLTEVLMSLCVENSPNVYGHNTRQWFERHTKFPALPGFFFFVPYKRFFRRLGDAKRCS